MYVAQALLDKAVTHRRVMQKREAALLGNVELAPIESSAGHRAGDPHRAELKKEAAFIRQKVHAHLATAVPGFS